MPLCCLTEVTSVHTSKADDLWWCFAPVGISHGNIYWWVWPKVLGIVMSAKSKQGKTIFRCVDLLCTLRTKNELCLSCVATVQARRTLKGFVFFQLRHSVPERQITCVEKKLGRATVAWHKLEEPSFASPAVRRFWSLLLTGLSILEACGEASWTWS